MESTKNDNFSSPKGDLHFRSQESESAFGSSLSLKSTVEDLGDNMRASDLTLASPSSIDTISMSFTTFNGSAGSISSPISPKNNGLNDSFRIEASMADLGLSSPTAPSSRDLAVVDQQKEAVGERSNNWRVVLTLLSGILLWKRKWYPVAICLANSLIFLEIWMSELTFLSVLSVTGFFVAAIDCLLPAVVQLLESKGFFPSENSVEDVKEVMALWNGIKHLISLISTQAVLFRAEMPRVFSMVLAFGFLLLAWTLAKINLLFLAYIISTLVLLAPGIIKNGLSASVGFKISISIFGGNGEHQKEE